MLALSVDELLAWSERTHTGWRDLLSAHPEALDFPCDVRESETVRDVVRRTDVEVKELPTPPRPSRQI